MENGHSPSDDAPGHIAFAERGQDYVLDDQPALGIGHDTLQAVADFDADLSLVGRDNQKRAVVLPLLSDAPGAAELIAVVLNGVALERLESGHHDLVAGFLLRL